MRSKLKLYSYVNSFDLVADGSFGLHVPWHERNRIDYSFTYILVYNHEKEKEKEKNNFNRLIPWYEINGIFL